MYTKRDIDNWANFLKQVLDLNEAIQQRAIANDTHFIPDYEKSISKCIQDLQELRTRHNILYKDIK